MRRQLQSPFNERQYMLSKDFEIYYYNDNHFYGVTDHTHDYYEFYFFLEGNVTISIEKEHHHLKPGDMVFIPPGIHHHVSSVGETLPYQRFVFWISQDYCQKLKELSKDYVYLIEHAQNTHHFIYHYDVVAFNAHISGKNTPRAEKVTKRHNPAFIPFGFLNCFFLSSYCFFSNLNSSILNPNCSASPFFC